MTGGALTILDEATIRTIVGQEVSAQFQALEDRLTHLVGNALKNAVGPADGMLRPKELAERLGLSLRELHRAVAEHRVPAPVYVGARSPRWPGRVIRQWEQAGCPSAMVSARVAIKA